MFCDCKIKCQPTPDVLWCGVFVVGYQDVLSECDQCGTPCDVHVNCANPSCHVRFLQCSACGAAHHSCCSRGCQQVRRPRA
jgi:predicted sulfurtransferase